MARRSAATPQGRCFRHQAVGPGASPANDLAVTRKAWSVLVVSTLAFTVCFMVWMMFGVIGIPIRKALNLNATEFGLLTAMPIAWQQQQQQQQVIIK